QYNTRILEQLRRMGCSCDWRRLRFTLDDVCARAVNETFFRFFKDGLIYRGLRLVNWDTQLQTAVSDDEIVHETVKGHLWHYRYPVLRDRGIEGSRDQAGSAGILPAVDDETAQQATANATRDGATMGTDYVTIATTRPETMLGDTAIAVHPNDERYQHLIGQRCLLPLQNRAIPIIADGLLVKREFGTGCVKVTPAHDPNDHACGQRHDLPMITILTLDGKINENGGAYAGLARDAARKRIVADLEAAGLMESIEKHETEVGHSDRSNTPIEPMLSEQWFVKMGTLAENAMEAVRDGRVRFFPERFAKTYLDWLGEKRDWCISRQLWWGHRIPVWSKRIHLTEDNWYDQLMPKGIDSLLEGAWDDARTIQLQVIRVCDGALITDYRNTFNPVVRDTEGEYDFVVCYIGDDRETKHLLEDAGFAQDPDVLDTWFSSALWPHSTFGWPESDEGSRDQGIKGSRKSGGNTTSIPRSLDPSIPSDLDYFYPTSVLSTARDIITLWVARMVMTGLYNMGRVPFTHVCIHPTIQDGQGRRMSKSLGNGVDPLDLIELYGTDAMRLTLAQLAGETQDFRLPVKPIKLDDGRTVNSSDKFELGRNFCNKLWQAATGFVLPNLSIDPRAAAFSPRGPATSEDAARPLTAKDLELEDRWILSRLSACIAECDRRLERYQFSEMINAQYAFFWSEFCDWYVELIKPRLNGKKQQGTKPRRHRGDGEAPAEPEAEGAVAPKADTSAVVARQVLAWVLDQTLRMLHPVIPFITEALWKKLNAAVPERGLLEVTRREEALITAAWPDAGAWPRDEPVEQEMAALQDVIRALRDIRARVNTIRATEKKPSIRTLPTVTIRTGSDLAGKLNQRHAVLRRLGQCEAFEIGPQTSKPAGSFSAILSTSAAPGDAAGSSRIEVYVPVGELADLSIERKRLEQERAEVAGHVKRAEAKLGNDAFVNNAPPAVVARERTRVAELRQRLETIQNNMRDINPPNQV
ncbi:MAG: valine--tRNA ligase, partial [Planctomycetes bacterium]|nr:valine--tRNA ligase [Planctomycetota bacterium]